MKKSKLIVPAAIAALITIFSIGAHAQATRTWVSGVGDDANPCSRTAPCKTWSGAIGKTATGGEIDALDPGGFGGVTITKSITLNGGFALASGLVSGIPGVTVNAPVGSVVILRNLSLFGISSSPSGAGTIAINFLAGGKLIVDNCDIREFSDVGINSTTAAGADITVKDTSIYHISGAPGVGINLAPTAGVTTVSLNNVHIHGGATGLNVAANSIVTISNSVISQNTGAGIATAGAVVVNAESVKITNNDTGILAGGTSTVRMSNLDIFNNTSFGITRAGTTSVLASFLNNKIRGNGVDGTPTVSLTQQ